MEMENGEKCILKNRQNVAGKEEKIKKKNHEDESRRTN